MFLQATATLIPCFDIAFGYGLCFTKYCLVTTLVVIIQGTLDEVIMMSL